MRELRKWHFIQISVGALIALLLAGCDTTLRQYIRDRDFRAAKGQGKAAPAPGSPIEDVPDMPGWSSDLEGAQAFSKDQQRRLIVFLQQPGNPASERAKKELTSKPAITVMRDAIKVTVDGVAHPEAVSKVGVDRLPAIVTFKPDGTLDGYQQALSSRTQIMTAITLF